uniref:Uncharacterized protein n=1 Tax=Fundulus heteroclitus TaxID=8078 RepID=A0A3Q2PB55_FUNHE
QYYLQSFGEHLAVLKCLQNIILSLIHIFTSNKKNVDAQMLSILAFPSVPKTADIVEGSSELTDNFKAFRRSCSPGTACEDYEKQVILTFFYCLLFLQLPINQIKLNIWIYVFSSNNLANSGWDILWRTYKKKLCVGRVTEHGLKFSEHPVPNSLEITEWFNQNSVTGERLLTLMTGTDHSYESFPSQVRAGILNVLRNKCSTNKDDRMFLKSNLSRSFVHA